MCESREREQRVAQHSLQLQPHDHVHVKREMITEWEVGRERRKQEKRVACHTLTCTLTSSKGWQTVLAHSRDWSKTGRRAAVVVEVSAACVATEMPRLASACRDALFAVACAISCPCPLHVLTCGDILISNFFEGKGVRRTEAGGHEARGRREGSERQSKGLRSCQACH